MRRTTNSTSDKELGKKLEEMERKYDRQFKIVLVLLRHLEKRETERRRT